MCDDDYAKIKLAFSGYAEKLQEPAMAANSLWHLPSQAKRRRLNIQHARKDLHKSPCEQPDSWRYEECLGVQSVTG